VGAVTTGVNVEGRMTAQHQQQWHTCLVLCYCCEGTRRDRIYRNRQREEL